MFQFKDEDLLEYATVKDVFKYVDQYDLFRFYIGDFVMGKPLLSPLEEEKVPSFSLFVREGKVLYNDFRLGGGDIINFVRLKFNLENQEAINKIMNDAGLGHKFRTDYAVPSGPPKHFEVNLKRLEERKVKIGVKRRKWVDNDTKFWLQYWIGKDTLRKFNVAAISHAFYNGKPVSCKANSYCFMENKDNIPSYTIYQPYNPKMKWSKSHDHSVFYGWSQLPEKGEVLILTKSLKDVMTVDSITGLPAVSLQSEKIKPKPHVMEQLKARFKNIYLLYDNDWANIGEGKVNYGREFGKIIADTYGLKQIEIPDLIAEKYDAKDISDLAKNAGSEHVLTMLIKDIENYSI